MRGIHWSPVNSPHKGQWRRALRFYLICAWINGSVNIGEAGDLRRHRARYDVDVMGNYTDSGAIYEMTTGMKSILLSSQTKQLTVHISCAIFSKSDLIHCNQTGHNINRIVVYVLVWAQVFFFCIADISIFLEAKPHVVSTDKTASHTSWTWLFWSQNKFLSYHRCLMRFEVGSLNTLTIMSLPQWQKQTKETQTTLTNIV